MLRIISLIAMLAAVSCELPPQCEDGRRDGDESDVDCGGSCSLRCVASQQCGSLLDCESGVCSEGICQQVRCGDHVRNGNETDIDCGGTCQTACGAGQRCVVSADCVSGACNNGTCLRAPTLAPQLGSLAGGTVVTLALSGHTSADVRAVRFGDTPATLQGQSDTTLNVITPAGSRLGATNVTIEYAGGQQQTIKEGFRYYLTKLLFDSQGIDLPSTTAAALNLSVGDLDQDGLVDIVAGGTSDTGIYRGDGTGAFTEESRYPYASHETILIHDFDKDGRPEILLTGYGFFYRILKKQTDFSYMEKYVPSALIIAQTVSADLNGDGFHDLIMAHNTYNGEISILLNKQNGIFSDLMGSNIKTQAIGGYRLASADFDGDGTTDIAITKRTIPYSYVILFNDGKGKIKNSITGNETDAIYSLSAADFDQDGIIDLVGGHSGSNGMGGTFKYVSFIKGLRDGKFLAAQKIPVPDPAPTYFFWSQTTGDLNGDGITDIIAAQTSAAVADNRVLMLLGKQQQAPVASWIDSCGSGSAGIADFNNDGKMDIAVSCGKSNHAAARVHLNVSVE